MKNLLDILKGCLFSTSVHQAESMLAQYSQRPTFLQQLLVLIPNQEPSVLQMILSTLKNYMLARYNPPPQNNITRIPQDQKDIIKGNILNLYYEISNNEQAVNLYKQIVQILILADYPWPGVDEQLMNDMNSNVVASVHFCRQFTKAYEYSNHQQQKKKVEQFIYQYFPKLQEIVEKCLTNFDEQTSKILYIILKTYFSSIHIDLPEYLKNQDIYRKWFNYIKMILLANNLQHNILNQRISAKILSRMVSQHLNQGLDSKKQKNLSINLGAKIIEEVTETVFSCLNNPNGDEQTASYILNIVMSYCQNANLRVFLNEQNVGFILYERLLPNMQTSPVDLQLFQSDPFEYIRKDQDLVSYMFKRNAEDTVERIIKYCHFGVKAESIKFIEYAASSLLSNTVTDRHKQVLVRLITKMSSTLKKYQFIKDQFENLTCTYFIPLLRVNSPLLNAEICRLLAAYLDEFKLSQNTVSQLMGLIYEKMIGKSMVLKYNSILAFTSLLSQQSALNKAKVHFQSILQIYVKMLDDFEHQNLLKCLESIVGCFSTQIVAFAPNLIEHLLNKFYETYNNEQNDEENQDDSSKQAIASLSIIEQILECPLSEEVYYKASQKIFPMITKIFDELQEYFGQVLSLVNVLVHKANTFCDSEIIYVLCRKLLEGKNCQIQVKNMNYDFVGLLNKITEESDTQYEANLISILKNLIKKLPNQILHKYPYPLHSQLILALIENKRLTLQQISQLNTHYVDSIWAQYLQSYKVVVYGQGSVTGTQNLKSITGVSLYPWLMNRFDVNLVKIVLGQIQSQQEQDWDYSSENTMQMLQKYAQEDDDEEVCDQYYGTEGVNYSFLYDSPYDSSKDRQIFIQRLKSLSNEEATTLMSCLSKKEQNIIQTLFK